MKLRRPIEALSRPELFAKIKDHGGKIVTFKAAIPAIGTMPAPALGRHRIAPGYRWSEHNQMPQLA
jgi:hypothetical protein